MKKKVLLTNLHELLQFIEPEVPFPIQYYCQARRDVGHVNDVLILAARLTKALLLSAIAYGIITSVEKCSERMHI
jgi:hypothetical protein